jgi:hypothetical protein
LKALSPWRARSLPRLDDRVCAQGLEFRAKPRR